MHVASVVTDAEDQHYAVCECGWRVGPDKDYAKLRKVANGHTDPEMLDLYVYETQLNYPHLTREEILG